MRVLGAKGRMATAIRPSSTIGSSVLVNDMRAVKWVAVTVFGTVLLGMACGGGVVLCLLSR